MRRRACLFLALLIFFYFVFLREIVLIFSNGVKAKTVWFERPVFVPLICARNLRVDLNSNILFSDHGVMKNSSRMYTEFLHFMKSHLTWFACIFVRCGCINKNIQIILHEYANFSIHDTPRTCVYKIRIHSKITYGRWQCVFAWICHFRQHKAGYMNAKFVLTRKCYYSGEMQKPCSIYHCRMADKIIIYLEAAWPKYISGATEIDKGNGNLIDHRGGAQVSPTTTTTNSCTRMIKK